MKGNIGLKIREINIEHKKQLVAEVARKLFVEKGFYAVTIPEIVSKSGVSTGTIYKYYGSKSGLARQLYEDSSSEFNRLLAERLDCKNGAYERAEAIAELLLDLADVDSTLIEYLFLSRHQGFSQNQSPVLGHPSNCILCQIFEEGIRVGDLRPGDPFAKAVSFLGVVFNNIEIQLKGLYQQPLAEGYAHRIVQRAWNAAY